MSFGTSNQESSSSSQLPAWYVPYAKKALERGNQIANLGYVPYQGADVAAFNPTQIAGMQNANDWSAAFNTPGQAAPNVAASLPQAQDFGNGLKGYSSYGGYMDQLEGLKKSYPGLWRMITAQAINPVTGRPGNFPPGAPGGGGGNNGNDALVGGAGNDMMNASPSLPMAQPQMDRSREDQLFGGGNGGGGGGNGGGNPQSNWQSIVDSFMKYAQNRPPNDTTGSSLLGFLRSGGLGTPGKSSAPNLAEMFSGGGADVGVPWSQNTFGSWKGR